MRVTVEWALLAACSLLLLAHTLPRAWRTLNTDFPNYYLTALLAHQGFDTAEAYDWRWLQREKDHRAIDQRVVGLAPITPFSTLFLLPLTNLAPLTAKHIWLILQLALLFPIAFMLRALTGQPLRRIAILATASFPLHRNLLYGQFYLLLLAMVVAACWAYRKDRFVLSGALIGLATMTKIFPAIFLLYFLRKRNWVALTASVITVVLCGAVSIAVFGWTMHRQYLEVVLPWTLRGEAVPPYLLASSSLSTLLHRLFVYEPQWNPHPWHDLPQLAAALAPMLQMLLLAPALLFIRSGPPDQTQTRPDEVAIEWSALLCVTLAISTVPASYNFTLLLLPMTALCGCLLPQRKAMTIGAALLYLSVGHPGWNTADVDGLRSVLHEPRLFLLIAFALCCLWTLRRVRPHARILQSENILWALAMLCAVTGGVASGLRHQSNLYADYPYRLAMAPNILLAADPEQGSHGIEAIGLLPRGYRLITLNDRYEEQSEVDQLSFASRSTGHWIEEAGGHSRILPGGDASAPSIPDARNPKPSADGKTLAYIHDQRGRGQLISQASGSLTPARLNVLDATPLSDGSFFVAASEGQQLPSILHVEPGGEPHALGLSASRYPALSPDEHWLAFSRYQSGSWNLWLLNRSTHITTRLTHSDCNQVEPSWEADSKTLLYASDCGRALGFTAICRRRIIP